MDHKTQLAIGGFTVLRLARSSGGTCGAYGWSWTSAFHGDDNRHFVKLLIRAVHDVPSKNRAAELVLAHFELPVELDFDDLLIPMCKSPTEEHNGTGGVVPLA